MANGASKAPQRRNQEQGPPARREAQPPSRQYSQPPALGEGEIIESAVNIGGAAFESLRAEIDVQVETARRWPRSVSSAIKEAIELACLRREIAESCTYTLPRDGKAIAGPSVRLAEIMLNCWGNIRVTSRVVGEDGDSIVGEAVCLDLERNIGVAVQARRRITTRNGQRYGHDMINTTANAAVSIALRNAVFRVIPSAFVNVVWEESKRVAVGDVKSFSVTRESYLIACEKHGITRERVCKGLGVGGVEDIGGEELTILQGIANSVKGGEAQWSDFFPEVKMLDAVLARQDGESRADALARSLKKAAPSEPLRPEIVEGPKAPAPEPANPARVREPGEDDEELDADPDAD